MDLTNTKISIIVLKLTQEWEDLRGKEFAKNYLAFVEVMDAVFQIQYLAVINFIKQNPHLFTGEDWLVLEKTGDYLGQAWNESNSNHIKTLFIDNFIVWANATNSEVKPEVNLLMEIDNVFAKDYAENHAGEFISRIDKTTRDEVNALFNKAFLNNWTQARTAEEIQIKFSQFSKYRAALIANMEMSNAYEYGKAAQFDGYTARYKVDGWKRNQDQWDGSVRHTHSLNTIEWWIQNSQLFSGTKTMHAPHDFNCRCTTSRRLTPPTVNEIVETQFEKDWTSFMDDAMKTMIVWNVQSFRMKYPFIDRLPKLTDFKDASEEFILGATTKRYMSFNALPSQWESINGKVIAWRLTGNQRSSAIVYHEMGHHLDNTLTKLAQTEDEFGSIPWKDINKMKVVAKESLYKQWKSWELRGSQYIFDAEKEYGYDVALHELFAESVVAHIMGVETDMLNTDMRELLDFLTLK